MLWRYTPLAGRALAVKIVLGIAAALAVLAVGSDAAHIVYLDRGGDPTFEVLRATLVGWLQIIALIAGAIALLTWLHAAYANLKGLAPQARRYDESWAVAAWLIPIANWFLPPKVLNDVVRAGSGRDSSPIVGVWWTVVWFAGLFQFFAIIPPADPRFLQTNAMLQLISDRLIAVAALLLIKIVASASTDLDLRARATQPRFDRSAWGAPSQQPELERPV